MTDILRIDRLGTNLLKNVPTAPGLGRNVRIHHQDVPGAYPVARTATVDGTMSAPVRFSLTVTARGASISPR